MVAHDDALADLTADIDGLFRLRPFTDDVSQAKIAGDAAVADVREYCVLCGDIAMDIGNNSEPVHTVSL